MPTSAARPRPLDSVSLRALEYCPEAIVVTMPDMERPGPTIVFVNKAFERLTGYTRAEALGRNPRFLQGPATDRAVLDAMRRAVGLGEDFSGQIVNYRRDGSPYTIEWKLAPMRDTAGSITHWVAVQREVVPSAGGTSGSIVSTPRLPERDIAQWLASHRANGSAAAEDQAARDRIPFAQGLLLVVEATTTADSTR